MDTIVCTIANFTTITIANKLLRAFISVLYPWLSKLEVPAYFGFCNKIY